MLSATERQKTRTAHFRKLGRASVKARWEKTRPTTPTDELRRAAAALVKRTTKAQELPEKISDPVVISKLADFLRALSDDGDRATQKVAQDKTNGSPTGPAEE